jgi:hypothetical protein
MNIPGESACPAKYRHAQPNSGYSSRRRHEIAFLLESLSLVFRHIDLRSLRFAGILVSLVVLEAVGLTVCIPTASITPGQGSAAISADELIHVQVPRFCSISEAAVFVDGEQRLLEQGIDGNEFTAPVNAEPGCTVSVEIEVSSAIGLKRNVTSTFTTAEPSIQT